MTNIYFILKFNKFFNFIFKKVVPKKILNLSFFKKEDFSDTKGTNSLSSTYTQKLYFYTGTLQVVNDRNTEASDDTRGGWPHINRLERKPHEESNSSFGSFGFLAAVAFGLQPNFEPADTVVIFTFSNVFLFGERV